jgi:hypothetical protein
MGEQVFLPGLNIGRASYSAYMTREGTVSTAGVE